MKGLVVLFFLAAAWLAAVFGWAWAMPAPMALCRNAAIQSADRHGIPREVMLAITLVETRTRRDGQSGPWPWTVNVAGKGAWFDSRAAALLHAQQALAGGQRSFDVGCFQLNFRWHGQHFASIDEMFEPGPSSDYAARFLKSLHAETGDWIKAAGFYHSRTNRHAVRYRGLVSNAVRAMGGEAPQEVAVAVPVGGGTVLQAENNNWPLAEGLRRQPGLGETAGSLGLRMLRQSRGGLISRHGG